MTWRMVLTVVLGALMLALAPYAKATPSNSNWLAGLYDDDLDDAVGASHGGRAASI